MHTINLPFNFYSNVGTSIYKNINLSPTSPLYALHQSCYDLSKNSLYNILVQWLNIYGAVSYHSIIRFDKHQHLSFEMGQYLTTEEMSFILLGHFKKHISSSKYIEDIHYHLKEFLGSNFSNCSDNNISNNDKSYDLLFFEEFLYNHPTINFTTNFTSTTAIKTIPPTTIKTIPTTISTTIPTTIPTTTISSLLEVGVNKRFNVLYIKLTPKKSSFLKSLFFGNEIIVDMSIYSGIYR